MEIRKSQEVIDGSIKSTYFVFKCECFIRQYK